MKILFLLLVFLINQASAEEIDQNKVLTLMNKIGQLTNSGKYKEAIPYTEELLETAKQSMGEDNPNYAGLLVNVAMIHQNAGDYEKAETLYLRGIKVAEMSLGEDHPYVISALINLAKLYKNAFLKFEEAEHIYKRIYESRKKAFGDMHPSIPSILHNLAGVYLEMGRYDEAGELFRKGIEITKNTLGKEHPSLAVYLDSYATFNQFIGRYEEAERLFKQALQIAEKNSHYTNINNLDALRPERIFSNLGVIYRRMGKYDEAEIFYKKAIHGIKETFGDSYPMMTVPLQGLAVIYYEKGMIDEAENLFKKIFEIRKEKFGENHINTLSALNNLGFLSMKKGEYFESEKIFQSYYNYLKNKFGENSPYVSNHAIDLAVLYTLTGKTVDAHKLINNAISIRSFLKEKVFLLSSEKDKINYIDKIRSNIFFYITHTTKYMQSDGSAIADTFNAWLKWKGSVLEAQNRYSNAVYFSKNPEINEKFEKFKNTSIRLARLHLSTQYISSEDYKSQITKLEKEKEDLEIELSKLSKEFSLEKLMGEVATDKIANLIPKGSTYIDFAKINVYDFQNQKFGDDKYFAFLLIPAEKPIIKLIEIGSVKDIDAAINSYQQEIKFSLAVGQIPNEKMLKQIGTKLYESIIKPIEPYIKDKKEIIVSPDGNISLIPFEVFVTPEGKYLIEDYNINYVTTGKDILRFNDNAESKKTTVVMADPDYDMGIGEKEKIIEKLTTQLAMLRGDVSRDIRNLHFYRLSDTKEEAQNIEKIFKKDLNLPVKTFLDKEAIEEILLNLESPKILHIATHGFFLKNEKIEFKNDTPLLDEKFNRDIVIVENPALRSGIVLAGANTSIKSGKDDGIVTSEKLVGLNLRGTDLVVLSACNTGVGDIEAGEGIFGLERAFILSGAKTLVVSLWSVPSKETTEMMSDFYKLLSEGKTKGNALKEAKLEMLKKKSNPFYWGAFVMIGKPN